MNFNAGENPLKPTAKQNNITLSDQKNKRISFNLDVEMLSENGLSHNFKSRNRVSFALQSAMHQGFLTSSQFKNATEEADIKQSPKQSKFGSLFRSKMNSFRHISCCEICEEEMKKDEKQLSMCDCEHKFNFCQSCLHHYVIYKVKVFQEVACPREDCSALMDTNGLFFKQLPFDIQKNYRKVHQFYQTANDPNKKLCPKQNCEGIISAAADGVMVCNTCESTFCAKCLLSKHEGLCDQHQVQFFQNNLHYRQCKQCKFVIEKNQGCNHMTCRCGYQFCYVCSAAWAPAHYGNHDQNGNLIIVVAEEGAAVEVPEHQDPLFDCSCCTDAFGETGACILKVPLKFFLFIMSTVFLLLVFIIRVLFVGFGLLLVTLLIGVSGFCGQFIANLQGIWCILGAIFFPICMIAGIAIAFQQFFWSQFPRACRQYCVIVFGCFASIYQI